MQVTVTPEDVIVRNARPLEAGLCKGSSDAIGWKPITVTHAMVGRKIAVFVALEAKSANGKPSSEQINFLNRAREAGALAGIIHSPSEVDALFESIDVVV
jgi:hypothetical protein